MGKLVNRQRPDDRPAGNYPDVGTLSVEVPTDRWRVLRGATF